jgi:YD repeat-containing protein
MCLSPFLGCERLRHCITVPFRPPNGAPATGLDRAAAPEWRKTSDEWSNTAVSAHQHRHSILIGKVLFDSRVGRGKEKSHCCAIVFEPFDNRTTMRDGRIWKVTNPEGGITTYAYDAANRRTVKRLSSGLRTSCTYDSANQAAMVSNVRSNGVVLSMIAASFARSLGLGAAAEESIDRHDI